MVEHAFEGAFIILLWCVRVLEYCGGPIRRMEYMVRNQETKAPGETALMVEPLLNS